MRTGFEAETDAVGRARFDAGSGHAPAGMVTKPLAGLARRYDATSLAAFLATPTPPMPAIEMTGAERRDLAAFLLARHP